MTDSFLDIKRRTLTKRLAEILEEYEAVAGQHGYSLDEGTRVRLRRQVEHLETEIAKLETELAALQRNRTDNVGLFALQQQAAELQAKIRKLQERPANLGIPAALLNELLGVVSRVDALDSNASLRSVFTDARLYPFRDSLPDATSSRGRVESVITHLSGKQLAASGENALVLLLQVLAERVDPQDKLHLELCELADKVAETLA